MDTTLRVAEYRMAASASFPTCRGTAPGTGPLTKAMHSERLISSDIKEVEGHG